MQFYLQTRGRSLDYAFLGEAPKEIWWSQYRNVTRSEDPTILVHSDGRSWRIYLSGISSRRKDRVGTTIRYTLLIEGECADHYASSAAYVAVINWLADAAEKRVFGSLQTALDSEFTESFVEDALGAPRGDSRLEVAKKTAAALGNLAILKMGRPTITESGSWVGNVAQQRPREVFSSRVRALLDGEVGRALLLNSISTEDEARAVVEQGGGAAILIEDDTGIFGSGTFILEKKKTLGTTAYARPPDQQRKWIALLLIGGPLLGTIVWLILRTSHD